MSNWLSIFNSDDGSAAAPPPPPPQSPTNGIKQDLADLGGVIAGHLRSAAAFFAPPPSTPISSESPLPDVAGVTAEVIEYVRDAVSSKSSCWTNFPVYPTDDFVLSDDQKKHASVVENLVPELKSLKHKMSTYMSEENFHIIYFVLLSSVLKERDKELLITPQINEARASFLHINTKSSSEDLKLHQEASESQGESSVFREKKVLSDAINIEQGVGTSKQKLESEEVKYEEDVSSSELEDIDNILSDRLARSKLSELGRNSSYSDSSEWVKLKDGFTAEGSELRAVSGFRGKDSEGEDSCGWLTVDEVDF